MLLISATVRNYRLHQNLTVEFDRARTVISGTNETGKSTFAEAIHRALFFTSKSGAEPQQRMRSSIHSGHPEVELVFEAAGRRYHLKKRFSGATGTTTLTPEGCPSLQARPAEEELARLLGVPSDSTPKASTSQWAHLWVDQGMSTADPAAHATVHRDALLTRLQHLGGAAAMQSTLDTRVAAHFATTIDTLFIQSGKPKTGSELERSETELAAAETSRHAALERVQRLQQAVDAFESSAQAIASSIQDLVSLDAQSTELQGKLTHVAELTRKLEEDERHAREAADRFAALDKEHHRIATLQSQLATIRTELDPKEAELRRREGARDERRLRATDSEKASEAAAVALRSARLRHDFATAMVALLDKQTQFADTAERIAQARGIETEVTRLREDLAKLPAIDGAVLKSLQTLESKLAQAQSALAAMATGVELVASDRPVTLEGKPLELATPQVVTEDTEICIGESVRLRIRPGGGISLASARVSVQDLDQKLRRELDARGFPSVASAIETLARRTHLTSQLTTAEARLADFHLGSLVDKHTTLKQARAAGEADVARRRAELPDFVTATDLPAAREHALATEKEFTTTEASERKLRAARESSAQALADAVRAFDELAQQLTERKAELTRLEIELGLLVEAQGDDATRARTLAAARELRDSAKTTVTASHTELDTMQPALLTNAQARLTRAIEEKKRAQIDAEKRQAVAQSTLASDGSADPHEDLAQCEARLQAAKDRASSARTHGAAIKVLDQLFRDEQRTLADQLTRPFADKISGYLQCLFGAGARAALTLDENEFTGLQLVRPAHSAGAVPFDSLSGGTREQLAAAVRLAMAEVLAADHEGCLPVVFDDSFTFSDRDRIKVLQDMLDLAASRGLQVIVLTCHQGDYAALGAREVALTTNTKIDTSHAQSSALVSTKEDASADSAQSPNFDLPSSAAVAVTDTLRAQFLAALRARGGSSGNGSLRDALGWDEPTYDSVKRDLINSTAITPGKGRGGSVLLNHAILDVQTRTAAAPPVQSIPSLENLI